MSKRVNLDIGLQQMLNGPWLVVRDDGEFEVVMEEDDLGDGWRTVIAECSQEQIEIAYLLASAPALLAALQAMVKWEQGHPGGFPCPHLEQATAAISQALGETTT